MTESGRARNLPLWMWNLLAIVAFTACAIPACGTSKSKHGVLSFFFDGVPDPSAPGGEAEGAADESDTGRTEVSGSSHRPAEGDSCEVCHEITRFQMRSRGFSGVGLETVEIAWNSCAKCHTEPVEDEEAPAVIRADRWLHGPVAVQRCRDCHRGHRSKHAFLLREERLETICRSCHVTVAERSGDMAELDCIVCHHPHSAESPDDALLRGGREGNCAKCHTLAADRRPWLHGPVAKNRCDWCHDAHGASGSENHVRRPIRNACFECHLDRDLSRAAHPEGDLTECDSCHESHAATSAQDRFLRERIARTDPVESAFVRRVPEQAAD